MVGKDLLKAFYKFLYLRLCDSTMISEKTMCGKCFTSKFERHLYMNVIVIINNYKYYKLSCKFVFVKLRISFLFCIRNKKQKSRFNQVGGMVTRNVFVFCL